MTAEIFKFPYDACRRVHSQKPRRSKNGTPEERAAKAAAEQGPPADVVALSVVPDAEPPIDRRKLRGSPLRDHIADISFGATIVGKMKTAELKGQPLAEIAPDVMREWLATLDRAIDATCTVNVGLDQAMETLKAVRSENSNSAVNLPDNALGQPVLNLADQHVIEAMVDDILEERGL
jgi:hypothetical protein